jgi:hypothetical protein
MTEKAKRTADEWYLILFGSGLALTFCVFVMGKLGLIDKFGSDVELQAEAPRFDRMECLNRNAYRIREEDPLMSDEMLSGDVARACVLEQRQFEGW